MSEAREVDVLDLVRRARAFEHWTDYPAYPLEKDFSFEEYSLRIARARRKMSEERLDALVITSSNVGQWFTSRREPHEWHDLCQARVALFILTADGDYLYMSPTAGGEHFNTTRRSTWVSNIRGIAERARPPRFELWDVTQLPEIFADLRLIDARLGLELGDCMTLGMNVLDFLRLRELLPRAQLVDASIVVRHLMSVHTNFEIDCLRAACNAGDWIHAQVPKLLRIGMTEREFIEALNGAFRDEYSRDENFDYSGAGAWDVRNHTSGNSNLFHSVVTNRPFKRDDMVFRAHSGVAYRGYKADTDRYWYLGVPPEEVLHWHRITLECNRAMAAEIRPGRLCSEVYAAGARVEERNGLPERPAGRIGHGLRNTGGLSVHPDNHTELEPNMVISVEPMFATEFGFFDLEDQFVVTATGAECLHEPAPDHFPAIE